MLVSTVRWGSASTATPAIASCHRAALQGSAPPRPDNLPCARILNGGATLRAMLARCSMLRPSCLKGRVDDSALARHNPELLFSAARPRQPREAASFVVYGMELWLRFFQVRPHTTYNSRRKRIEVKISGMPPLPGALALQIMLVLTRWSGIAICSSCGRLFSPSRRPNPNRNAYCKGCGVRAAWREAQARRRERKLTNQKTRRIS